MQRSTKQHRLHAGRAIRNVLILLLCLLIPIQIVDGDQQLGISISLKDVTLDKVFREISKQTGYSFTYAESELQGANKVTIEVSNASLENVLSRCFHNQPLTYTIVGKTVIIRLQKNMPAEAKVLVKGTDITTTTDTTGDFMILDVDEDSVVAYNTTIYCFNTGAVAVVKGEQIQTLPNRSFDKRLQGLVPGLLITSGNVQPGSPAGKFMLSCLIFDHNQKLRS